MTEQEQRVLELVSQAAVYVPFNCEGISITWWQDDDEDEEYEGCFWGIGEESGEEYKVFFSEVNLEKDIFYKLVAMN